MLQGQQSTCFVSSTSAIPLRYSINCDQLTILINYHQLEVYPTRFKIIYWCQKIFHKSCRISVKLSQLIATSDNVASCSKRMWSRLMATKLVQTDCQELAIRLILGIINNILVIINQMRTPNWQQFELIFRQCYNFILWINEKKESVGKRGYTCIYCRYYSIYGIYNIYIVYIICCL